MRRIDANSLFGVKTVKRENVDRNEQCMMDRFMKLFTRFRIQLVRLGFIFMLSFNIGPNV